MLSKKDLYIILIIFVIGFSIKLFTIPYPIAGNAEQYLFLAENIDSGGTYALYGETNTKFPPMWPLFITFFLPFFNNSILAIKFAGITISSIVLITAYIFARVIKLSRVESIIVCALLLFNPWFFYFSGGFLPVSEGLAATLYILALIFFVRREDNSLYEYLSALFLALLIVTKIDALFFVMPFLLYYGVKILKKEKITANILKITIILVPFGLWLLRNLFLSSTLSGVGYDKIITFYLYLSNIPVTLLTTFLAIFYATSFILPFIIYGLYKIINKNIVWKITLWGFIIHMAFFILTDTIYLLRQDFSIFTFGIMRTRRLIIILPVLTTVAVIGLRLLCLKYFKKQTFKKVLYAVSMVIISVFLLLALIVNNGFVQKNFSDNIIDLGNTYTARSYDRSLAFKWINYNAKENANIIGVLNEPMPHDSFKKYFREDLNYFNEYYGAETGDYYFIIEKDRLSNFLETFKYKISEIHSINNIKIYQAELINN